MNNAQKQIIKAWRKGHNKYIKQKEKTKFTFKLLNLIKKCREKGKFQLAIKIIDKHKLDRRKLEEEYYD